MMGCFTSGGDAATSATNPSGRSIGGEAANMRKGQRLQFKKKAKVHHAEQDFMHTILRIREAKSSLERSWGANQLLETNYEVSYGVAEDNSPRREPWE
jgi:hypothetical protein